MAHTPSDPNAKPAAGGGVRDLVDDAARDLAEQLAAGGDGDDQAALFDAPLFGGPVSHVRETLERSKGRGRPKGAANKRTAVMREYLLARGYRHPMENLADLANADPVELQAELSEPRANKDGVLVEQSCTLHDAMQLIVKANVELLPYFESKRPVEVEINEKRLGVLLIGELGAGAAADDGVMSLTGTVREGQQNQEDSGGDP